MVACSPWSVEIAGVLLPSWRAVAAIYSVTLTPVMIMPFMVFVALVEETQAYV